LVRQDLWDAGTIRKPADLRGKIFDSLATGAPVDFIARTELAKAGLTTDDLDVPAEAQDASRLVHRIAQ
jgi:hypothetical protein